ncbi:hypothetical protein [Marinilabilia rubra]|uniref:Right handed beta helix domain-containing protein n=1 Tax=Marinilabilia rubra TaxID=2162893 RepID=A0A2U2B7U3_9BACT|nr:hypothetical protein [Marinilabilia rubra]PWD99113.1 hypothetical protein DDZ16_12745 [Marinilabilia rubra]
MSSRICVIVCLLAFAIFESCEREYVFRGESEDLSFSVDTLAFDTVFTSVGSTTKNLRVYNPVPDDVVIEAIELVGGDDSDFIMNVNGTAGSMIRDIPLRGNDSLFVFVEVNVNPTSENTPFVVSDSIFFYTKNKIHKVQLLAYGQNVVPLRKENLTSTTFTNEKPYLIYDWVVVDSAETLTIDPGARLHFHKDAFLIVFGSIRVNGEIDNPVMFSSDRLDEWYEDKPGQWGYIQLMPGSSEHHFNNAIIKNSTMGLVVDSVGVKDDEPPLKLNNVRIEHISSQGLIAQNSRIEASNSVFADCGSASVALTVGGHYEFYHCTIANYFNWDFRSTPAVVISNYFTDNNDKLVNPKLNADFFNSIIVGRNSNEIRLDFKVKADQDLADWVDVNFSNSMLKVGESEIEVYSHTFKDVLLNEDPAFIDVSKYNYQLDSLSFAQDIGNVEIARQYPKDALGVSRLEDKGPDLGAYERVDAQ